MKHLCRVLLCVFTWFSVSANASFISGNHTTDGGKTVRLQGLEWMPLTYTAGIPRSQVEAPHGFIDRFGNSWGASDWRYATRAETETLLTSLWGGTVDGRSNDNYDGANWFLSNFGGLGFDSGFGFDRVNNKYSNYEFTDLDFSFFVFGKDGDCTANSSWTCSGYISTLSYNYLATPIYDPITKTWEYNKPTKLSLFGHLSEGGGVNMGTYDANMIDGKSWVDNTKGSLLVRQASSPIATVPTPNLFSLLMLGLFIIGARRRLTNQRIS